MDNFSNEILETFIAELEVLLATNEVHLVNIAGNGQHLKFSWGEISYKRAGKLIHYTDSLICTMSSAF